MKIKCDYCDSTYEDTLPKCPSCGAPNPTQKAATGAPETIEELAQWYRDRNLPPENVTRFFIGKDVREAKAFGIYRDPNSGEFVVYKNKADGSRAVRYRGGDEAYAVNELWQRLKDEIVNQKHLNANKNVSRSAPGAGVTVKKPGGCSKAFLIGIVAFLVIGTIGALLDQPRHGKGYYRDGGTTYYYASDIGDQWYLYDEDAGDWVSTYEPDFYSENRQSEALDAYWLDSGYSSSWAYGDAAFTDVLDSEIYQEDKASYDASRSSYSSDDSSYDWDSGDSWDSGGTDWGSDW